MNQPAQSMVLRGIDGANPLAFLAALGAAIAASSFCPELRLCWCSDSGLWRAVLHGCTGDEETFAAQLCESLQGASMLPFEIAKKLPFSVGLFKESLDGAQLTAKPSDRRMTDFLAAFGTEIAGDNDAFKDTRFRMVRSGDSAGQGLSAYAMAIRRATDQSSLRRALFQPWDYSDSGFTLRWDPIEDQRYALRWRDPSKSTIRDGPGTMIGANSLAIEALQWYPTMLRGTQLETTGFHRNNEREVWFTWPIWICPVSLDTVRSLVALQEIHADDPPREKLARRGIVEIYRSQRIQQNQYYSNFTLSEPA